MLIKLRTLAISLVGVFLLLLVNAPLPFLFGPMLACLLTAFTKLPLKGIGPISNSARSILGVAVGASITPLVIEQLPIISVSLAIIPLLVILMAVIGVPFFIKFAGYDRKTAYYAAMPGGLQDMVIFGAEAGGDIRALSLTHATRLFLIVVLAPLMISSSSEISLQQTFGIPAADLALTEIFWMVAAAIGGWKIAEKLGLFGASILGPMIAATILSLTDILHQRPPHEAIIFAQFFIGMGIGIHYTGITLKEVRTYIIWGAAYVVILGSIAFIIAYVLSRIGVTDFVSGFLAFAPGGQAEMAVLAIVVGADLGFVVLHHLFRMIIVLTGAPLAFRLFNKKSRDD